MAAPQNDPFERMRYQIGRQRREQSVKYPGTDKPITGAIERRIR